MSTNVAHPKWKTMKLSVFKKVFKNDTNILRVTYVIFLISIISYAFMSTAYKYRDNADIIIKSYEKRDSIIKEGVYSLKLQNPEFEQLKELYNMIAKIKEPYLYIAHTYTAFNYSFIIFFTIFSIISGILGFLILKKGWDNSDDYYLKASFLIVFFFSTLFGVLPKVFVTKENIKNNLVSYNYFNGLQLDIYDLARDNKGYFESENPASLDSLNTEILSITEGIKVNQNLYFDIHVDKVPTEIKPLK